MAVRFPLQWRPGLGRTLLPRPAIGDRHATGSAALELGRRHLAELDQRIAQQRNLIKLLRKRNLAITEATRLLTNFEEARQHLVKHCEIIERSLTDQDP